MSEYDSTHVYVPLERLQEMRLLQRRAGPGRGQPDPDQGQAGRRTSTSSPIKLQTALEQLRPMYFRVSTWEQKQGPLLAAVAVEQSILNILLFFIIAVAGFGILAIFSMIVVEKTRDIGVMKALGASTSGVRGIFLGYGLLLGLVGSGVGMVGGLLFVRYINEIEKWLSKLTGRKVFDDSIYYFDEIPTLVEPWTVAWIVGGALFIAVAASIWPAQRAASSTRSRRCGSNDDRPGSASAECRCVRSVSDPHVHSSLRTRRPSREANTMTIHLAAMRAGEELSQGEERGPGAPRGRPGGRARRARGGRRRQRVGQEHAPARPRPARRARRRRGRLDGQRIDDLPDRQRDALRNRTFGFIFQFYHLLPELSALENVMMPQLIRHGVWSYLADAQADPRARRRRCWSGSGLGHRLTHRPSELSGGEMQRAAIARALAGGPGDPPGRRADRQPRRRHRPGRARAAPRLEPRARAHYDDGHPRSPDRPAGRPGRSARRGADRGMGPRPGLTRPASAAALDGRGLDDRTVERHGGSAMRMSLKVYIGGKLYDKADAKISVYDHGLLYGDGVFEGIRSYSGRVFRLSRARRPALRLGRGRSTCRSRCPRARWPQAIVDTLAVNKLVDAYIRVVVTRGAGSLGLDPRKTTDPQVIIITDAISLYPAELYEHGLKIVTAGTMRNHPSALEPADQVAQLPQQHPGQDRGDQRRLPRSPDAQPQGRGRRVHRRQHLRRPQGRAAHPVARRRHPRRDHPRRRDRAGPRAPGITVFERTMDRHDIYTADECFLTGTAAEVIPVVECDGRPIGAGKPGPITRDLRQRFHALVREERIEGHRRRGRDPHDPGPDRLQPARREGRCATPAAWPSGWAPSCTCSTSSPRSSRAGPDPTAHARSSRPSTIARPRQQSREALGRRARAVLGHAAGRSRRPSAGAARSRGSSTTRRDAAIDLIVIATHGRTGLSHVLLGSVAERIVREAPCPVLTIRDRTT